MSRSIAFIAAALVCACAGSGPTADTLVPSASPTPPIPAPIAAAERWIEVDLATSEVILHSSGAEPVRLAAATGVGGDPAYTTPVGSFRVQSKEKGPTENVPGVFVSDIIMVDLASGTGIHSMPMDSEGHILDDRVGPSITAGCIRVADSGVAFEFAELGMPVWIH